MSTHQQLNSTHGGWQSHRDIEKRRKVLQLIIVMLQKDDKFELHDWLNGLPAMVQQLEAALYRSAPSLEVYADTSTLRHRLKLLAIEIAKKTSPLDIIIADTCTATSNSETDNTHDSKKDLKKKQQLLLLLHHVSQCPHGDGKCLRSKQCTQYKYLWHHISHCTDGRCSLPRCQASLAILSHFRSCKNTECELCSPLRQKILSGG